MGRKKADVSRYIQDDLKRAVTYAKRKRGLIKKCIELSKMCDVDISLSIFDKKH